jgi:hypothetical protein
MTNDQEKPAIIDSVPGISAPVEQGSTQASTEQPILRGPRQVGSYDLPSGGTVVHEITPDGMKQVRNTGTGMSAAEFHAMHGVATPGELQKVAGKQADIAARDEKYKNARVIYAQGEAPAPSNRETRSGTGPLGRLASRFTREK